MKLTSEQISILKGRLQYYDGGNFFGYVTPIRDIINGILDNPVLNLQNIDNTLNKLIKDRTLFNNKKEASWLLGFCYSEGLGVVKDIKRAVDLFHKSGDYSSNILMVFNMAASQGDATALHALSQYYAGRDEAKHAAALSHEACDLGNAEAYLSLADHYERGSGVKRDLKRSVLLYQFYQTASEHAQNTYRNYATRYQVDLGCNAPNLAQALDYYNDRDDFSTVGFCHQLGLGVNKNLELAVQYFEKALKENQPCYWDIFLCYKTMHKTKDQTNDLKSFYEMIRQEKEKSKAIAVECMRIERLYCLAYLNERGGPCSFESNLSKAADYYKQITEQFKRSTASMNSKSSKRALESKKRKLETFMNCWSPTKKHEQLRYFPIFNSSVKTCTEELGLPSSLGSLIALYAFEPGVEYTVSTSNPPKKKYKVDSSSSFGSGSSSSNSFNSSTSSSGSFSSNSSSSNSSSSNSSSSNAMQVDFSSEDVEMEAEKSLSASSKSSYGSRGH